MYAYQHHRRRFWLFGLGFVILFVLAGVVVQTLWNAILPAVAGAGTLSLLQALGLLILSRILVGAWHKPQPFYGKPWGAHRWMNMTEAEKEKFSHEWQKRCGRPYPEPEQPAPGEDTKSTPS